MTPLDFERAYSRAMSETVGRRVLARPPLDAQPTDAVGTDGYEWQEEMAITKPIAFIGSVDLHDLLRSAWSGSELYHTMDGDTPRWVFMGVPLYRVDADRFLMFAQAPR